MNDFTKEELICLRDNLVVPDNHKDKNILLMAYHKLLGMIDNYCEHEWATHLNLGKGIYSAKCRKCGAVLNDNQ